MKTGNSLPRSKRSTTVMRENGLFSRTHKKYRITTDSNHDYMIADNLIDRDFETTEPGQKMVSDTTVVETGEGDLYAAAILDLYGRMPVGLAMGRRNNRFLVMDAFKDMLVRGCVFQRFDLCVLRLPETHRSIRISLQHEPER